MQFLGSYSVTPGASNVGCSCPAVRTFFSRYGIFLGGRPRLSFELTFVACRAFFSVRFVRVEQTAEQEQLATDVP